MRRRSSTSGLWALFVFLLIFGSGSILPLFLIVGVTAYLAWAATQTSNRQRQQQSTNRRTTRRTATTNSTDYTKSSQSRADLARINVYLRKYFKTHKEMDMPNNLSLSLRDDSYRSLYSLDVFSSGKRVGTMAEFRNRYPDMYNQLYDTLLSMAIADAGNTTVVDAEIVDNNKKSTNTEKTVEKGALYYAEVINDLNADIPDQEITNGLYESTALLKQLADMEKKFPDSKNKLEKLYQYYLPIQVRILNQYTKLQNVKSDPNYESTVTNLKKTIQLVNQAMEQLISDMSDSDFINLSADMSTLEAVLQKDGLAKNINMNAGGDISLEIPGEEKK